MDFPNLKDGKPEVTAEPASVEPPRFTEDQVRYMVNRFLTWRLPENFNPDGGISFKRYYNEQSSFGPMENKPVGTNLLDAVQAESMVRYLVDGLPTPSAPAAAPTVFCMYCGEPADHEHPKVPGPPNPPQFFSCCGGSINAKSRKYGHQPNCPKKQNAAPTPNPAAGASADGTSRLINTLVEAERSHELRNWWRGLPLDMQEEIYRLSSAPPTSSPTQTAGAVRTRVAKERDELRVALNLVLGVQRDERMLKELSDGVLSSQTTATPAIATLKQGCPRWGAELRRGAGVSRVGEQGGRE